MSDHMVKAVQAARNAYVDHQRQMEPALRAALPHLVEELIGRSQEWGSCSIEHLRAAARRLAEGEA